MHKAKILTSNFNGSTEGFAKLTPRRGKLLTSKAQKLLQPGSRTENFWCFASPIMVRALLVSSDRDDEWTEFVRLSPAGGLLEYFIKEIDVLPAKDLINRAFLRTTPEVRRALYDICSEFEAVELYDPAALGWLYQAWSLQERDNVTWSVSGREPTIDDPSSTSIATQVYTDEYIVEFLLHNALGGTIGADIQDSLLNKKCFPLSELTICDPACGSGHFLFPALRMVAGLLGHDVYEAVDSSIYGMDLDVTAVELARFAVILQAIQLGAHDIGRLAESVSSNILQVSPPWGTLLRPSKTSKLENGERRYSIIATNPPYLGRRKLGSDSRRFLEEEYPDAKLDLFAAFIVRSLELLKPDGILAWVSMNKWLFLPGYRALRQGGNKFRGLLNTTSLEILFDLGAKAFSSWGELHDGVRVALTCVRNSPPEIDHTLCWVTEDLTAGEHNKKNRQVRKIEQSKLLTQDSRVVLFLGKAEGVVARCVPLSERADIIVGVQTSDDARFVQYHWRVQPLGDDWVPHAKGGGYKRWFGCNYWLLDRKSADRELETDSQSGWRSLQKYVERPGWTYAWLANGCLGLRSKPAGFSFGRAAASGVFTHDIRVAALLNSRVTSFFARRLGGKIQLPEGIVKSLPLPRNLDAISVAKVEELFSLRSRIGCTDIADLHFSSEKILPFHEMVDMELKILRLEGDVENQICEAFELSRLEKKEIYEEVGMPIGWFDNGNQMWLKGKRPLPSCGPIEEVVSNLKLPLDEVQSHLKSGNTLDFAVTPVKAGFRESLLLIVGLEVLGYKTYKPSNPRWTIACFSGRTSNDDFAQAAAHILALRRAEIEQLAQCDIDLPECVRWYRKSFAKRVASLFRGLPPKALDIIR